jgi:Na+/H+ antiporter NhaD/arsenite permease-like protein
MSLDVSQILAIAIFVAMFIAIIIGKLHRSVPALIGAALVIFVVFLGVMKSPSAVINVLNLHQLIEFRFWIPGHEPLESQGVNWQTIIFIGGMMMMVEALGHVGFFRWLCLHVARLVGYRVVPILIAFMLLSGFMAMFIDSITVLLFLASVTIEMARLLKFDPVPVIIAEIFASNVGGSATMCGDPPNIIIGTAFGYTFTDFIVNTGVIAWAGMILTVVYFYFASRRTLAASHGEAGSSHSTYPQPKEAITNRLLFVANSAIFMLVVVLLITHAQTGLSVAIIGVMAAGLTLLAAGLVKGGSPSYIVRRLDWRTLLFFVGLFICVGGLEETGVLRLLAEYIGSASGGSLIVVMSIILWLSAFASAIVDNIPFAATMVPVISNLSQTAGFSLPTMSWALALGTDIGGNATPIGASANVVGTAIAEREGYPIGWGRFLKYALPAMILVVGLCHLLLIVLYT